MERLRKHPSYPQNAHRWFLLSELFVKCSKEETTALVDGKPAGKCPARVGFVTPESHEIEWRLLDGTVKNIKVELKEGTIHKFKYLPESDELEEEVSRDGVVQVHAKDGTATELSTLVQQFLVDRLEDLPEPDLSKIFPPLTKSDDESELN